MAERKILRCGTVFPGCNYVIHGESEAEVLGKMTTHAREAHEAEYISDDFRAKIQAHIQPEK